MEAVVNTKMTPQELGLIVSALEEAVDITHAIGADSSEEASVRHSAKQREVQLTELLKKLQ